MQELKIFEEKQIRTVWDKVQEKWYFCIIAHNVEEGVGYATLTDIIYQAWVGLTARDVTNRSASYTGAG